MPELPEVETVRRGLERTVLGQMIAQVDVSLPKIVKSGAEALQLSLVGNAFTSIERRGKLLLFSLKEGDESVLVHLKMTGQLIFEPAVRKNVDKSIGSGERVFGGHPHPAFDSALPGSYTHLIVTFESGDQLFYNDLRQFGYWQLATVQDRARALSKFGVEPLSSHFTEEHFEQLLATSSRSVLKSFLLNQQKIAGLGNIYVDEACFHARVRPTRLVGSLEPREKRALFQAIRHVLSRSVELRGTTFRDYLNVGGNTGNYADELKVYGRAKKFCLRCEATNVSKIKFQGRGTHFCAKCQL